MELTEYNTIDAEDETLDAEPLEDVVRDINEGAVRDINQRAADRERYLAKVVDIDDAEAAADQRPNHKRDNKRYRKAVKDIGDFDPTMLDEIAGMSEVELRSRICASTWNLEDTAREQEEDVDLNGLKEAVKEKEQPYKDARRFQDAIRHLCTHRLEEMGKL